MLSMATEIQEDQLLTVGNRLKRAREEIGLSRRQVADETGISMKMIEKYEYDTAEPPLSRLKLLCQLLDVPMNEIMDEVKTPQSIDVRPKEKSSGKPMGRTRDPVIQAQKVAAKFAPDAPSASDSLNLISELVAEKGVNARRLPELIRQAEVALAELDYDDMFALGVPDYGLFEDCHPPVEVMEFTAAKRDMACNALQARLIATAVYGTEFESLSDEAFEIMRDQLEIALERHRPFLAMHNVVDGQALFESDEKYRARLFVEMPPALIEAIKVRNPVPIPSVGETSNR